MDNSLLRLLHLVSPTLPTGAFSYSQGLEWAVEKGWIFDMQSLESWLHDVAQHSMVHVDIPLLQRMYRAVERSDSAELESLIELLLACRETSELQEEEQTRGRAMATLLHSLGIMDGLIAKELLKGSQLAGYVYAAQKWQIPLHQAAQGYLWAWLENQVITGIKIVPLGQTQGQQILLHLSSELPAMVEIGLAIEDADIGASSPSFALACSLHESQYTRLYRS
jgi:urease accessory protein